MARNVILAASLPAPPEKLFDMYLDPVLHAAFTGAPVEIEPRAGAPFRAFGGSISGTILHVEPKRLIVQTWRSVNFSSQDIDSVLVITFWPADDGARIELAHINVADSDFAGVSHGWEKYYWTPWRVYLTKGSQALSHHFLQKSY
jgi:activator of HSP90 ATPase